MSKEILTPDQEQGISDCNINSLQYITNPTFVPCEEDSPLADWKQTYFCMDVTL
jgi:hypothetical protein